MSRQIHNKAKMHDISLVNRVEWNGATAVAMISRFKPTCSWPRMSIAYLLPLPCVILTVLDPFFRHNHFSLRHCGNEASATAKAVPLMVIRKGAQSL